MKRVIQLFFKGLTVVLVLGVVMIIYVLLSDHWIKSFPQLETYAQTIVQKGDGMLCKKTRQADLGFVWGSTKHLHDACFRIVSAGLQDVSLCEHIQDRENRNYCIIDIATAVEDPLMCNLVSEDRWRCYESVARKKDDPAVCDMLKEELSRVGCREAVME